MADAPNRYVTMKFGGVFPLEACEIVWYVDGEYRANMYENKDLTGYICGVPKGTEVIYMMHADPDSAKIRLPDGRIGWVNWYALSIPAKAFYTRKDYTDNVKETWINKQNYTSSTQYLVWCNLYTQRVNIFKGSKGNWKLVYSSICAIGSNDSPTPQEVTQILYKTMQWDYPPYQRF